MTIADLETTAVQSDLQAALARAKGDIAPLREKLAAAEKQLAAAESERQRCNRMVGSLNSRATVLLSKIRQVKGKAMISVIEEKEDPSAYTEYLRLKTAREFAISCLSFANSYSVEDAHRDYLLAQIAERTAFADLTEGQASLQRLAMSAVAAESALYDPGVKIDTSAAWSAKTLEKVAHTRSRELPALEKELAEQQVRVERERELIAAGLWS